MCFSATASFTTASVLLVTAAVSLKKASAPRQQLFAAIPLVFGLQQLSEGFLWLSFSSDSAESNQLLTATFLFFAHVIWPFYIPLAYRMLENNERLKKILTVLVIIGAIVSAYLLFCLFYYPVHARITAHHIYYDLDYPDLKGLGKLFYFIPTMIPPFVSGIKWMWVLGTLNVASFLISKFWFKDHIISVWCFMAAVISVVILLFVIRMNRPEKRNG
jgi:hypothetical protein